MLRPIVALTLMTLVLAAANADDGKNEGINNRDVSGESPRAVLDVTTEKSLGDTEYEEDGEDEEEEVEGEEGGGTEENEEDEYEEELREMAESHEAMSRDDRRNSTSGINHSDAMVFTDETRGNRNFDSHGKSAEEHSDKSITLNEAIRIEDGEDDEVRELLKYKRTSENKMKRVPTVKKELRTQKEVQGNETRGAEPTEIVSLLEERRGAYSPARTREIISNDLMDQEDIHRSYPERSSLHEEIVPGDEYLDVDASLQILGKLDKRHQSDLDGSEAYPPSPHIPEFERQKIQELETEVEDVLAEELMNRLSKLARRPTQWDRASLLLRNLLDHVEVPNSNILPIKRSFSESGKLTTKSPPLNPKPTPKKQKKKKKKKKKKPRRFGDIIPITVKTTSIPFTPATTTISPEVTSQSPWRLVAERLFRPSWLVNHNEPTNLANIQYAISNSKQSGKSQTNPTEYINDEPSSHLILESAREYPLQRKFHFGKVNTHEKGSPLNQHDTVPSSFEVDTNDPSASRVLDYDLLGRAYQQHPRVTENRYDQYYQHRPYSNTNRLRDFNSDSIMDYDEAYSDIDFSRHRAFYNSKPRKYQRYRANTRFNDPFYDEEEETNNRRKNWATRFNSWKSFWRPIIEVDDTEVGDRRIYGKFSDSDTWPIDKNIVDPWSITDDDDTIPKVYNSQANRIQEKNKNHSELNKSLKPNKDNNNNNPPSPKITMKTWNSLTSDPATWPFKLSGAKPWPKDKNGKSYNPNAELVRKLGLDKQNRLLNDKSEENQVQDKDNKDKNTKEILTNSGNNLQKDEPPRIWNDESKIWPSKVSETSWKSHERWQDTEDTWPNKLTDWNVDFNKQSSQSATWPPSKWKQFSYHKVNASPGSLDTPTKSRNAFIAVSAVSPSKFPGNEWRKNDIDETPVDQQKLNNIDQDDPTNQLLQHQLMWKKRTNITSNKNETDPLEHQLDELRQNNLKKRVPMTLATYLQSTTMPTTTSVERIAASVNKSTIKTIAGNETEKLIESARK